MKGPARTKILGYKSIVYFFLLPYVKINHRFILWFALHHKKPLQWYGNFKINHGKILYLWQHHSRGGAPRFVKSNIRHVISIRVWWKSQMSLNKFIFTPFIVLCRPCVFRMANSTDFQIHSQGLLSILVSNVF